MEGEEGDGLDLKGGEVEGAVVAAAEDLDEFPAGAGGAGETSDGLQGGVDAQLLANLAGGGGGVGLAGVHVAGGAGVPEAGVFILPERAFLQEELALSVENEHVDGAVA